MKEKNIEKTELKEDADSFEKSGYIVGSYRATKHSYGFITPDNGCEDYFVAAKNSQGCLDKDRVVAERIYGEKSDEARVVKVLSHTVKTVIGTLVSLPVRGRHGRRIFAVEPDDEKLHIRLVCTDTGNAKRGDKVEAEIITYPSGVVAPKGRIIKNFGSAHTLSANYDSILHIHNINTEYDKKALSEADIMAQDIPDTADGRCDLRNRLIFTIDGADAKDLDDAVSVQRNGDGYILGVHIADVSHYVLANSALDKEAYERGCSVYFTDKVVPMLPRALSCGICSLNPGVDRRTLSCFVTLDKNAKIIGCDIKKSLINSRVRGVYSEVNDLLEKGVDSAFYGKYSCLYPDVIPCARELYEKLERNSRNRGSLELETTESIIMLDGEGYPERIVRRDRGTAEKMIEQFMLCANEAVASWLFDMGMPCVYRVHEDPDPEKIQALALFAHNAGLDTRVMKAKKLHPSMLADILRQAKEKNLSSTLSNVLLRSLSKARYSAEPGRHFGLCIDKYCHFTSPIRRYPDLATHRIITNILSGNISEASAEYLHGFASKAAEKSSENEIRAMNAERDIEDMYKCIFMYGYIGKEFEGVVSSVTSFGFFVELENTCEGLVPLLDLSYDYVFDKETYSLSNGMDMIKLGQRARVIIDNVDVISRRITMRSLDY